MHPAVLREGEAAELQAEIFHHVRALKFPMHKDVQPDFLLKFDRRGDLVFQKIFVVGRTHFALIPSETRLPDFRRLRE